MTNGQVVALFDQVCQEPSFERLAQSQATSNFSLGAEGNTRTGELALTFAFNWVGACLSPSTPGPCEDQEYWLAWPANNTTAGPFQSSHVGLSCACPAVLAHPPLDQQLPWIALGVVSALAIAGIVAVVVSAGRRRGRGPPPPTSAAAEAPPTSTSR